MQSLCVSGIYVCVVAVVLSKLIWKRALCNYLEDTKYSHKYIKLMPGISLSLLV